jgi:hypothetical protein
MSQHGESNVKAERREDKVFLLVLGKLKKVRLFMFIKFLLNNNISFWIFKI